MALRERLSGLFGEGEEPEPSGLEQVKELLAERERTLGLTATFEEPYPDTDSEPTIVFPYTVLANGGQEYSWGRKEFPLPDAGLNDEDSDLVQFLAKAWGKDPAEVTFEDLAEVEGVSGTVELAADGDYEVTI